MSEPFIPNTFQKTTHKLVSQDWSLDEVTLEGWCHKEKGTDEFMLDTSNISQLSEDCWNEENKPSVFKNALVNLSEGLAAMHKKDILNSVSSNRKNNMNKTKNFNIKSTTSLTSKRKIHSGRSKTSQKENCDKDIDTSTGIIQQSEPNLPDRKSENDIEPNIPVGTLNEIDIHSASHHQEDDSKALTDSTPKVNTSMKEVNKSITEHSEDIKDSHGMENVLKSGKASNYGSELGSASQLELDFESDRPNGGNGKKYSVLIKKSKLPMSQRSVRQIPKDDLRINKSLLQNKQVSSPQEIIATAESAKLVKRDSIPLMPLPQNPKNVAFIKELQTKNPMLKIDGIGQNRAKQMKENEASENLSLKKRVSEPLEVRNNNTSLRTVFGQAFKDAEAPPLFTMNLKGTSIGRQKEAAKENIKESVDYILGLYKSGADKTLEKGRTSEVNATRDSFKVTENLKRTSYHPKAQPLKEKLMNQEDIVIRGNSRSQTRTDIAFRVKKIGNENAGDDKRVFMPGTVKVNEIVFQ